MTKGALCELDYRNASLIGRYMCLKLPTMLMFEASAHSSTLLPGSINKWFLLTHSWHSSPIQCNASNAPSSTIMHGATQSQGASGPSEAWPITTQWHKSTKTGRAVDHPSSCTRTTQLFKQQPSVKFHDFFYSSVCFCRPHETGQIIIIIAHVSRWGTFWQFWWFFCGPELPFFVEPNLNGRPSAISVEELGLESEFGAGMLFVGLRWDCGMFVGNPPSAIALEITFVVPRNIQS